MSTNEEIIQAKIESGEYFRILNRQRTVGLYAELIGRYTEYTEAEKLVIDKNVESRTTRIVNKENAHYFRRMFIPSVIRFCGSYYKNGCDPNCLPHPIRIAIELKNGRKEGVLWGMKHLEANKMLPKGQTANGMISKVISLMHDHGMYKETEAHNG